MNWRARLKLPEDFLPPRLVVCGKRERDGRLSCGGLFGKLPWEALGTPRVGLLGIYRFVEERQEWDLSDRNRRRTNVGRKPRLRRDRAFTAEEFRRLGPPVGEQGEDALTSVALPAIARCQRCGERNELGVDLWRALGTIAPGEIENYATMLGGRWRIHLLEELELEGKPASSLTPAERERIDREVQWFVSTTAADFRESRRRMPWSEWAKEGRQ